jgi:hypothetical protein
MYSFRRLAIILALSLPATYALQAQSSSTDPATPDPAQQPAASQTQGQISVQARIKARREQRRAAAIHDTYARPYETYVGIGYLRFIPGADKQRVTLYAWNAGVTRYFDQRLGATVDGRGYYGTPFVGLNPFGLTRPAISIYSVMGGPTYRFYMQPRYSISGRVLAGYAQGNFSGDTGGLGGTTLGLYKDGYTFAASGAVIGEYNLTPRVGLRLAPEYFITGFGSTTQASRGFTAGLAIRLGKQ